MADDLRVETIPVGQLATNCYIVSNEKSKLSVVIDPGDEADKIIDLIEARGLEVTHIINTHGHFDHIGANGALSEKTGASIYINKEDEDLLRASESDLSSLYGEAFLKSEKIKYLSGGQKIEVGKVKMKIISTPGHTRGGISLFAGHQLFVGDALFSGSIGRTDLPGGDFDTLIDSIRSRLLTLPNETIVYPGHGPNTTIGAERIANPYLK